MQAVKEYMNLKTTDQDQLKRSFIDACQDPNFKSFVQSLNIDEKILMRYTSLLEEAFGELEHCQNCKGLAMCQNKVPGYLFTPQKAKNALSFSYDACHYEVEKNHAHSYQKYIDLYDIPEEMKDASFKDLYRDDKKRLPIIKYFKTFLDTYDQEEKPKGLYLHGSFGSGKTYMIAALLNELAKRNISSAMVYFPEFLRHLKSSFHEDYEEKFNYIRKVPVLLLDDVGAENLTPWSRDEILGPILQYRMDHHLPTFFTSNLTLEELETHLGNTASGVDKVKARRIIERIKQLTCDLELVSANRRV